jgi:Raf kinase inhibitor-like YbhB/YbcL family protein
VIIDAIVGADRLKSHDRPNEERISMKQILACLPALLLMGPAMAAMTLTSSDIQPGAEILRAQIYPRCGGENISPQLSWTGAPLGTKSFVLTMIDISVKPSQWSHWIVVDLPANATSLARGTKTLPGDAKAIPSNFGDPYYDGPCPPNGTGVHEYRLTIWALPIPTISFAAETTARDLNAKLSKLAIDHADLSGFVKR